MSKLQSQNKVLICIVMVMFIMCFLYAMRGLFTWRRQNSVLIEAKVEIIESKVEILFESELDNINAPVAIAIANNV